MTTCRNISLRGNGNPQNDEYDNTVAPSVPGSGGATTAALILEDVPCDATVYVTAVVRMNGATAINALATNKADSNAIGIVISKSSPVLCTIAIAGSVDSALFPALDITKQYYLDDAVAGAMTTTPPTASGAYVIRIGQPLDIDTFIIAKERVTKRA